VIIEKIKYIFWLIVAALASGEAERLMKK